MTRVLINGAAFEAAAGDTVAAALIAAGRKKFRLNAKGAPRGLYCGIGVCQECLVVVNGEANVRACMRAIEPDMRIDVP
ncbi:MAG: (2Fe-2S)-binding protein [Rhodospirillales bacterium]|nr:(2Fe-2S)-binding protein [Rhodospirillales bacterium]